MKERVYFFDNYKCFLILMVILGHSLEPYLDLVPVFRSIFIFIYAFHMPAFLFVSGLFSVKTIADGPRCKERILYFLSLYLLLKIIRSISGVLLGNGFHFRLFWEDGLPWFLFALAFCYGVTRFLRRVPIHKLLLLSILLACLFGYDSSMNDYFCIGRCISYYPFFLMGYMQNRDTLLQKVSLKRNRAAGVSVVLVFCALCFIKTEWIYPFRSFFTAHSCYSAALATLPLGDSIWKFGGILRLLYYPLCMLLVLSFLSLIPNRRITLISVIGQRTLPIYFWHRTLLGFVRVSAFYPLLHACFPGSSGAAAHVLFSFLLCCFFALPFWEIPFSYIEKLLKKAAL